MDIKFKICLFCFSNKQSICILIIYPTLMLLQTCFFCETQNNIFWRMFCPYNKYHWLWVYGQNRFWFIHWFILCVSTEERKIIMFGTTWLDFTFGVTVITYVYYFGVYMSSLSILWHKWRYYEECVTVLSIHLKKVSKCSGQCAVLT